MQSRLGRDLGRGRARAALAAALTVCLLVPAAGALAGPSLGAWTATGVGLSAQTGVACPAYGLCVSVSGTSANVSTAPTTAGSWHPQSITGLGAGPLHAISCVPGSTFCVAVGSSGAVAVSTNVGSSSTWSGSTQDSGHNLTSVSCTTTSFCLAVDASGGTIYSTNSGASWTIVPASTTLTAVACASSALCAATDATDHIYVSTAPTTGTWTRVATDGNGNLTGIACTPGGTCVAVDAAGFAGATANTAASPQTWSWTPVTVSALGAVTCTPAGVCVATGSGSAYATDSPAASTPAWAASTISTTATAVGCTDQGLCAAVDGAGGAYVSTLPAPAVTTGAGTATSQSTASLAGTVSPGDAALTNCYFEYGPTTSYGSSAPCSSTPTSTGGTQSVSADIAGLTGGTVYHFQLVATNAIGSTGGGDQSFTTQAPLRPSPSISGTAAVGDTLTCGLGVTLPAGATATYTWTRDTTTIVGATGATYIVALADQTHHLLCTATISGDGGSSSSGSGYVSVPSETLGTIFETIIGSLTVAAHSVTVPVTCSPQALPACSVTLTLTSGKPHHTVRFGTATARVAPGAKATVTVNLNSHARSLLAHNHHLKTTLTISGTVVGVIKGTLKRKTVTFKTARHGSRH